jgi:hypothetical protein
MTYLIESAMWQSTFLFSQRHSSPVDSNKNYLKSKKKNCLWYLWVSWVGVGGGMFLKWQKSLELSLIAGLWEHPQLLYLVPCPAEKH